MVTFGHQPKIVLTIAGFDPSSGAGVTADLKTIAAHGLYGTAVITALTIQTTQGVRGWEPVQPSLVRDTLEALVTDMRPAAVKIGMLGSGEVAAVVAEFLAGHRLQGVVLDPVVRSSSGADLLDEKGFATLRDKLLELADVVTPNLMEAGMLADIEVNDLPSMQEACRKLKALGANNVVVTGGHLPEPTDLLAETQLDGSLLFRKYHGERISTENTHGTGCAFSTALACNLALGASLAGAVQAAKTYVAEALRNSYAVGKGTSPINHFFGCKPR
jgi:hydroxymethylpyrimidine/phosphomethylpyrimidine kinase